MATTTNYSWSTPDDTALVKDGAAAIRTLGSSVDTTVKALNPETTLGDLAYRSSTANVKTRLGLGTAGQVLTVNSGATAPEWKDAASGGNFTLLNAGGTTLSGLATVTVSGISGKDKILVVVDSATSATANQYVNLRLNTDTGSNYNQFGYTAYVGGSYNSSDVVREISSLTSTSIALAATSNNASSGVGAYVYLTGCNASGVKVFQMAGSASPSAGSAQEPFITGGFYSGSSTISSISITAANSFNGGTVYVYTSA
jgi:hypothetical protein